MTPRILDGRASAKAVKAEVKARAARLAERGVAYMTLAHFGKTSQGGTTIASAMDFATALLNEALVAVVPGEDFGTGGERCFRFTFACSEEQIRAGAERIATFVGGLQ